MARLSWGTPGERIYELGVDRGVVYIDNTGYVWNGLSSVSEKSPGGSSEGLFLDGYKYGQLQSFEDYEATVEAYSAPLQFAACGGTKELYSGLSVTHQPRKQFAFSYRTLLRSDASLELGYKIHLIYNALATASEMTYSTLSDGGDIEARSWDITTNPPLGSGYRSTSHYVVNTTRASEVDVTAIEDILYGTESTAPRFPTVAELVALFA